MEQKKLEVEILTWPPNGPKVYRVFDPNGWFTRDEAVRELRAAADDLESRSK